MNHQRLKEILAAYGAQAHRWPEQERQVALRLLREQPHLEAELQAERALDQLLDAAPATTAADHLIQQTLQRAASLKPPQTWSERALNWLWPDWPNWPSWQGSGAGLWRPATALALPFVLGIALGLGQGAPFINPNQPASLADSQQLWALEMQVAGFALTDEGEEEGFWP